MMKNNRTFKALTFTLAAAALSGAIACAACSCTLPNSTEELVPLPVTNVPRAPISGAASGYSEPSVSTNIFAMLVIMPE